MTQNPAKRKCPDFESDNVVCTGETDIELETFSFTWTISNYSVLSDLAEVKSPTFYGGPKSKHGWKLILYPKYKYGNIEYVSVYLKLFEYGNWLDGWKNTPVKTHFQISILNADGQPGVFMFKNKTNAQFTKASSLWGVRNLTTSANLADSSRRLIVNDTLKILCQVWIRGEMKEKVDVSKGRLSDEQRSQVCNERLANDLGRMFTQSIATDVTISTGKTSFKAHKTILSARSSVFAAMFTANIKEKEIATVQVLDFDNEVVKGMLEYLYTGKTTVIAGRAQELLQIAEKYNLEGLKEDCEYAIADNLSKENAAEILVLAHNQNAPILKAHAISYINSKKEELLQMKSFQDAVKAQAHAGLFADLYLSAKESCESAIRLEGSRFQSIDDILTFISQLYECMICVYIQR